MSWRTVCAFAACSQEQLPVRSSLDAQRQRRRAAQHEAAVPLSWLRGAGTLFEELILSSESVN
jgi:hypothetical protein